MTFVSLYVYDGGAAAHKNFSSKAFISFALCCWVHKLFYNPTKERMHGGTK